MDWTIFDTNIILSMPAIFSIIRTNELLNLFRVKPISPFHFNSCHRWLLGWVEHMATFWGKMVLFSICPIETLPGMWSFLKDLMSKSFDSVVSSNLLLPFKWGLQPVSFRGRINLLPCDKSPVPFQCFHIWLLQFQSNLFSYFNYCGPPKHKLLILVATWLFSRKLSIL